MTPLETLPTTPPAPVPGVFDASAAGHTAYLDRMDQEGVVPDPVAGVARVVWEAVRRAVPGVPVPAATAAQGGPIHYTWDCGRHHLEMEFPADGSWEWFYRDRDTECLAGEDDYRTADLPADLLVYLRTMYADS